ncbi:unnamed protein product, partial [Lampetra planeri]
VATAGSVTETKARRVKEGFTNLLHAAPSGHLAAPGVTLAFKRRRHKAGSIARCSSRWS